MLDHLMHILMSALSWFGAFGLAAIAVGLLAYLVGRIRKTTAAGETPAWRPHPAWATPARAASAAAFASLILWGVLLAWPIPFLRMLGCALAFIAIVGITPAAYRPGGATWSVLVGLVPFAAYLITAVLTQDFVMMAAVGLICAGVLRGWLGIPDFAYYAAAPPIADNLVARFLRLVDGYIGIIKEEIVGLAPAKAQLVGFFGKNKPFFSPAPSIRPLILIIAGPHGAGRHHLAVSIGKCLGVHPAEPEAKVDYYAHLLGLKVRGAPSYNLIRSDISLGRDAMEWLGRLAATGRHADGDDWGRMLITFVVDIDRAVAAGAGTPAGHETLLTALRGKLDPRIVAMAHVISVDLPTEEDQIHLAAHCFRREALRHGVHVTEVHDDAMVAVIDKANRLGLGIAESIDIAATTMAAQQFAAMSGGKTKQASIAADGTVIPIPA